ncbi:hypothetical protein TIFTF001_015297 [Ficus carica]|uniref:Uncharacterized protein n=1 Tax=Ficus carica TaxID=3494 RepID=A0AA88A6X7_FICCA|nr:hypothetical protein TIFTF001_015297 [Ficus carica]
MEAAEDVVLQASVLFFAVAEQFSLTPCPQTAHPRSVDTTLSVFKTHTTVES